VCEISGLNLYRSRITNAGLDKLRRLSRLQLLDVRYSGVTNAGVDTIRAALPKCRVSFVNTAPSYAGERTATKPADVSDLSVARWIQAMGAKRASPLDGSSRFR
jgi:hypothetical protein